MKKTLISLASLAFGITLIVSVSQARVESDIERSDTAKKSLTTISTSTSFFPFKFEKYVHHPAVSVILNTLTEAFSGNPETYNVALTGLKAEPAAVKIISDEYTSLPQNSYLERWTLVWLLSELRQPQALGTFRSILNEPVTEAFPETAHEISPFNEKMMILMTAVHGLRLLALEGDEGGFSLLLKSVKHPQYGVRRAATETYLDLASDKEKAKAKLKQGLDPSEYFFLETKRLTKLPPIQEEVSPIQKDGDSDHSVEGGAKPPPIVEER